MRKLFVTMFVLVLMLVAGGIGAAAARPEGPGMGPHGPRGPLARLIQAARGRAMTLHAELNLTEEQHAAIKGAILSHKQELATAIQPAITARRALRDAVLADKTDDAAIQKAAQDLGKKVGDAAVVIAKVKADVLSKVNLTPEQKSKIDAFIKANDASVDEFFSKVGEIK
jgi:Spy/CpxP family protein refolding chaperone